MKVYKCDRCDHYFDKKSDMFPAIFVDYNIKMDLCPVCQKQLLAFAGIGEKQNKENEE